MQENGCCVAILIAIFLFHEVRECSHLIYWHVDWDCFRISLKIKYNIGLLSCVNFQKTSKNSHRRGNRFYEWCFQRMFPKLMVRHPPLRCDRGNRPEGGVCFYVREDVKCNRFFHAVPPHAESIWLLLRNSHIIIDAIYAPQSDGCPPEESDWKFDWSSW